MLVIFSDRVTDARSLVDDRCLRITDCLAITHDNPTKLYGYKDYDYIALRLLTRDEQHYVDTHGGREVKYASIIATPGAKHPDLCQYGRCTIARVKMTYGCAQHNREAIA